MPKNKLYFYNLMLIVILILLVLIKFYFFNRNLKKINNDVFEFNFFAYSEQEKCHYQTKSGINFYIKKCQYLESGEYYTIIGKAHTLIDNKVVYRENFDMSSIILNQEISSSDNIIFHHIRLKVARILSNFYFRFSLVVDNLFANTKACLLVKSLFLGTKVIKIDTEFKNELANLGLAHMIAVSGFHLNLIYLVLDKNLAKILSKKRLIWILMTILLMYAFLVGTPLSIVRALLMIAFPLIASSFFYKQCSSFFSLFLAFVFMSLYQITNIFDIGFQLSFLATWGVLLAINLISKSNEVSNDLFKGISLDFGSNFGVSKLLLVLNAIKTMFLSSLLAQLFTLPLMVNVFQEYALSGILSSIIFSPIISLLMICLVYLLFIAYFLIDYFWLFLVFIRPFSEIYNRFFDLFFLLFDWYSKNFTQVVSINIHFSLVYILAYYFFLLLLYYLLIKRRIKKHAYIK